MRNIKAKVWFFVFALVLGGCRMMHDAKIPETPIGLEHVNLTAHGNERFFDAKPVLSWWEKLEDEQLNFLISWALEHNKDVRIALANLEEARAAVRENQFDRFPAITSEASYQRLRASEETAFAPVDPTYNNYEAGFNASWELDLFGRVSAQIRSTQALSDMSLADLWGVYVFVAAETASNYVKLRGAQYRLDIARRNAENQRETYELTKRLTEGGRGTQLDVSRALTQLELTQSTIPALEAEVNALIHRLSVLTGQVPDALRSVLGDVKPLPSIPVAVNLGDVSGLLKRRPDVAAARHGLAMVSAQYDAIAARQFPVVSLIGSIGFAATNLSNFGASALAASVGPSVSWTAFDMGRVWARMDQSDARVQRAVVEYEKSVLEALEDLQTAVSNFSKEEERREFLQKAAQSSKESASLARARYEAGVDTFIDVLSAEATLLEAEDLLAQSEINAIVGVISVYRALGGGWSVGVMGGQDERTDYREDPVVRVQRIGMAGIVTPVVE
ncbi:MAG: efflux transporter outer membrane subunit [Alphaproteobacteria bacterium]